MKPSQITLRRERQWSPRAPYGYTRDQLREIARAENIPRGRNTTDTLRNLAAFGVSIPKPGYNQVTTQPSVGLEPTT